MASKYIVEVDADGTRDPIPVGVYSSMIAAHNAAISAAKELWVTKVHIFDETIDLVASYQMHAIGGGDEQPAKQRGEEPPRRQVSAEDRRAA